MIKIRDGSSALRVFILFFLFFVALFIQFPLNGSLPGYVDTWLYLALFNDYWQHVVSWFTSAELGHCLYPAAAPYGYLEPTYASAPFFWVFKALGFNDLWAYGGFVSMVFALNATGAFLLGKQYTNSTIAALFIALSFAASNFAIGNLEHQNALFYFPALLSIYNFRKYLLYDDERVLKWVMIYGGLQIYFGTYTFIFQSIVLLLIGLVHYRIMFFAMQWVKVLKWLPLYVLLVAPYIVVYLMNPELAYFYNPSRADPTAIEAMSLNLGDLMRVLPNNLLYDIRTDIPQIFVYNIRSASLGFTIVLLAFVGMLSFKRYRAELLVVLVTSFIIAIGPSVTYNGVQYTMPMGWLYSFSDTGAFLRHPVRIFMIVSLVLSIFAGAGLVWSARNTKLPLALLTSAAAALFIVENIPFPLETYYSSRYIVNEEVFYPEIERADEPKVLLELPSTLDFDSYDLGKPINQFTREYIYMYWQSKHGQHVLNGAVAFFPPERINIAELIASVKTPEDVNLLIDSTKLDYIIYHPDLLLKTDNDIADVLELSTKLIKVTDTEGYILYRVQKADQGSY